MLLSPFELQLAPPIPHEDLTTALPSSSDTSATLAGYLAERVFPLSSCVPSRSNPTFLAVASLVVARHPTPSYEKLRLGSRLSAAVRHRTEVIARVRARRSLSYLFRKLLQCAMMAAKVVASEWLWSWVTCRARDAVGGGSAEGGDRPGGPAGGACLPGLVRLPATSGSQATLFQLTGSRSVFSVVSAHRPLLTPQCHSLYMEWE